MNSWKTTVLGFLAAGLLAYTNYNKGQLGPQEVMQSLAVAGLGMASKDHDK